MLIDSYRFGSGGGGGSDPHFSQVQFLLHADGTDGSTSFVDSSGAARTISHNGSAAIDTAQSKFGGSSALFPDGDGNITIVGNLGGAGAGLSMASSDWTVECWARRAAGAAVTLWFKNPFTTLFPLRFQLGASGAVSASGNQVTTGASAYALTGLANFPNNQWVHLAVVRDVSTFRLFQDGVQQATGSYSGTLAENNAVVTMGDASGGAVWIDDLRTTIGVARYTADFTPPTAPFPDS